MKKFLCALALLAGTAHAQFVTSNSAFGANSIINDTLAGTSWLNLSFTQGLSFDTVAVRLAVNPLYANFRVASAAEVTTLFGDAGFFRGGGQPNGDPHDPARLAAGRSFADAFVGYDNGRSEWFFGRTTNTYRLFGPDIVGFWTSGVGVEYSNYTQVATSFDDGTCCYNNEALPQFATWLIARDSTPYITAAVPEPSTYLLMLTGLLGMAFLARRRFKG